MGAGKGKNRRVKSQASTSPDVAAWRAADVYMDKLQEYAEAITASTDPQIDDLLKIEAGAVHDVQAQLDSVCAENAEVVIADEDEKEFADTADYKIMAAHAELSNALDAFENIIGWTQDRGLMKTTQDTKVEAAARELKDARIATRQAKKKAAEYYDQQHQQS